MGRDVKKQLMVEVPTALFEQLQRECDFSGMTKQAVVQRALELYLGQFLSDANTETLSILREAMDFPDRKQFGESAVRHYIKFKLEEREVRERFNEVKQEREQAANRGTTERVM